MRSPVSMRRALWSAVCVTVAGGLLNGVSIGYVSIAIQYHEYESNCTRFEASPACSASVTGCDWVSSTTRVSSTSVDATTNTADGLCVFPDRSHAAPCAAYHSDESACKAATGCEYEASSATCRHTAGYAPLDQGLLAAMMIVGAMLGCPAATPLVQRTGRRAAMGIAGVCVVVGVALCTVAWQRQLFGLLLAGRVVWGFGSGGISTVVSPMYCGDTAPVAYRNVVGVLFQLMVCFGIFLDALIGVVLSPRTDTRAAAHVHERFHVLHVLGFVTGLVYVAVGAVVPEVVDHDDDGDDDAISGVASGDAGGADEDSSTGGNAVNIDGSQGIGSSSNTMVTSEVVKRRGADSPEGGNDDEVERKPLVRAGPHDAEQQQPAASSVFALARPAAVGFALSASLQLTGINAIMNYAPHITQRAGFEPFVGNVLLMAWNFVATLGSVPLSKRFTHRTLFLSGTLACSLACLLTGIPTYPGVVEAKTARDGLTFSGLLLFIGMFEFAVGPPFFPLAQQTFPPAVRSQGTSYIQTVQWCMNLAINFGYPVAVQGLAGGPDGDQDRGRSIVFLIFGSVGLCVTVFLFKFL